MVLLAAVCRSSIGGRSEIAGQLAASTASTLANAATRSALDGSSFGDNITAAIPDIIGQALGNAIVGQITPEINDATARPTRRDTDQGPNTIGEAIADIADYLGLDGDFGYQGRQPAIRQQVTEDRAGDLLDREYMKRIENIIHSLTGDGPDFNAPLPDVDYALLTRGAKEVTNDIINEVMAHENGLSGQEWGAFLVRDGLGRVTATDLAGPNDDNGMVNVDRT